jgi:phage anti-repressor protein
MSDIFSIELAKQLINSQYQFPVDFNDAWIWLDYSTKASAKRFLIENFNEEIDFNISVEPTTTGIQANPNQNILLTIDCLKMWGMMAGTEKGKEVRKYFLQCEKIAKEKVALKEELSPQVMQLLLEKMDKLTEQVEVNQKSLQTINLLESHFQGVNQLIQDSLYNTQEKHSELLKTVYSGLGTTLTVKQVFSTFYKNKFMGVTGKNIINKVRCNISNSYFELTRKLLPTKKGSYVFDINSVIFLLWKIDTIIIKHGYGSGDIVATEIEEILKNNEVDWSPF